MTDQEVVDGAMRLLQTPGPFRAWLAGRVETNRLCGMGDQARACPVHLFLYAGGFAVNVGSSYIGGGTGPIYREAALPEWAVRFLDAVDTRWSHQRVLTRDALAILDQIIGGN